MIEMYLKKQWGRIALNVALVAVALFLTVSVSGCTKTIVDVKEASSAQAPPDLMVKPSRAKKLSGKANLKKHLRQQAAERRQRGDNDDRTEGLQDHVRDSQKPTPP